MSLTPSLTTFKQATAALTAAAARLDVTISEHAARGLNCDAFMRTELNVDKLLIGTGSEPGILFQLQYLTNLLNTAADVPFPQDPHVQTFDAAQDQ